MGHIMYNTQINTVKRRVIGVRASQQKQTLDCYFVYFDISIVIILSIMEVRDLYDIGNNNLNRVN